MMTEKKQKQQQQDDDDDDDDTTRPALLLSDYEKLRLSKIARNEEKLKSLGLWKNTTTTNPAKITTTTKKKKKRKQTSSEMIPKRRRSSRLLAHTTTPIIKQEEEEGVSSTAAVTPDTVKSREVVEDDNDEIMATASRIKQEMLDKMKYEIDELRRQQSTIIAVKQETDGDSRTTTTNDDDDKEENNYRQISKKLWGDGCNPPPDCSWKTFYLSRKATPSPNLPSQMGMYQELYAHDGWKILICCALMSRVSSFDTKDRCIRGFFQLCPKPSDVAQVNVEELSNTVHSLGFQYERIKAITEISRAWLTRGTFTIDSIDEKSKGGNKIYMCGPFVIDSYHLFCKGQVDWKPKCKIRDVERFSKWLKKTTNHKKSNTSSS